MLEVYQKRTFIEIDTNIWNFLAIFLNVVFKENKRINLIHPFIQIIPQGGLPRGRCYKSSRAEFQNSMCDIDLFFQQNDFQRSLVEQLARDPNLLPYFWKAYSQNTAKSGQKLC